MSVRKTINDTDFWYCLLDPAIEHVVIDENGNETGEILPHYNEAVSYFANISPATGQAQTEQFGNLDSYDKVIVTRDVDCPIDENSVLFIEKEPEYTEVVTHEIIEGNALYADDEIAQVTYRMPKNDYIVKRVAESLNGIAIAVRKVDVG
jgi:hypothetical protein